MSRKLQIARRCQLLTGSFDDNQTACPCASPGDCELTEFEREQYAKYPEIKDQLRCNRDIYDGVDHHV